MVVGYMHGRNICLTSAVKWITMNPLEYCNLIGLHFQLQQHKFYEGRCNNCCLGYHLGCLVTGDLGDLIKTEASTMEAIV